MNLNNARIQVLKIICSGHFSSFMKLIIRKGQLMFIAGRKENICRNTQRNRRKEISALKKFNATCQMYKKRNENVHISKEWRGVGLVLYCNSIRNHHLIYYTIIYFKI